MYNRNKIGPRLEPWGTPHFSCLTGDILLFTEHILFRPERYDSNHFKLVPLIPHNSSYDNRM